MARLPLHLQSSLTNDLSNQLQSLLADYMQPWVNFVAFELYTFQIYLHLLIAPDCVELHMPQQCLSITFWTHLVVCAGFSTY